MSETPTFKQINKQESSAYLNRSDANPTVLVGRSDGHITVGRLDKDTRKVHFSENGSDWEKKVTLEGLSDDHQAYLAEKLAGKALRGSGVNELKTGSQVKSEESSGVPVGPEVAEKLSPEEKLREQMHKLQEGLSESDKTALHWYAYALYPHEEVAQRDKMSSNLKNDWDRLSKARQIAEKISKIREAKSEK